MTGRLIESRARRQRRTGGAAISAALHLALIAGAVAVTKKPEARAAYRPDPPVHVVIIRDQPAPPRTSVPDAPVNLFAKPIAGPTIDFPTLTPTEIPEISAQRGPSIDSLLKMAPLGSGGGRGSGDPSGLTARGVDQPTEWGVSELLMRIVSSTKPRYPDNLRTANIEGRVLVRFTVDTAGRIDPASIQVLESTHDLFTQAVRRVLSSFRFKPAEVNGVRVRSLAEMPFEFSLTR